jgi:phosphoenolpyruvate-protein kinase (PTS system EI component)
MTEKLRKTEKIRQRQLKHEQQHTRIKTLADQGYSANQIQKKLKAEGLGMRRTELLAYIREVKHKPTPKEREKYRPKSRTSGKGPESVTIRGMYHGRSFRHTRRGRGKSLYEWVRKQFHSGEWDYVGDINS